MVVVVRPRGSFIPVLFKYLFPKLEVASEFIEGTVGLGGDT